MVVKNKDGMSVKGPMQATMHGLYFKPERLEIIPDSPMGRFAKRTLEGLLERFPDPPPLAAVALAQRLTYKLIRAASFEAYVLQSGKPPAPTADANYLSLAGSIRADIQTLWGMSKDAAPEAKIPTLEDYLKTLEKIKGEAG
jgi:hypothetical protein